MTMKVSKFTDAQNAFIRQQDEEGAPVAEICRKAAVHCPAGSCKA